MKWLFVFGLFFVSSQVLAFHEVDSFDRSSTTGGGAGGYFTGSKQFKGYDCNMCHLEAEHKISISLDGDLTSGTYEAGRIYRIEIGLLGEHKGLDSAFNPNTFTAGIVDFDGESIGRFSGGSVVETASEGTIAIAEGFGRGETEWSFSWAAPADPVPAILHIAMLDGDGASDPVRRFIDPLNDDVATIEFALCPSGMTCESPSLPPDETSPAGCYASPSSPTWFWILAITVFLTSRRRTWKTRIVSSVVFVWAVNVQNSNVCSVHAPKIVRIKKKCLESQFGESYAVCRQELSLIHI